MKMSAFPLRESIWSFVALTAFLPSNILLAQATKSAGTDSEPVRLSAFTVEVKRDQSYAASNALSGTRTNVPIADIPVNIQVLTGDVLSDFNAAQGTDMLNYFSSVSTRSSDQSKEFNGNTALFGEVVIRGLPSNVNLRDGVRSFDQPLAYITERVEIVKGPAAILYGLSEPGGIYNIITKQPSLRETFGEVSFTAGSYANYRGTLDYNVLVSPTLAFRLNAVAQRLETEFWWSDGRDEAINPAVTWQPFENTTLTASYEYDQRDRGYGEPGRYRIANSSPSTTSAVTIGGVSYPSGGLGPTFGTTVRGAQVGIFDDPRTQASTYYNWSGPDSRRTVKRNTLYLTSVQRIFENFSLQTQYSVSIRRYNDDLLQSGFVSGNTAFRYPKPVILARWQNFENKNGVDSLISTGNYEHVWEDTPVGRAQLNLTFGVQYYRDARSQRESVDATDRRKRRADGSIETDNVINGGQYDAARRLWFYFYEPIQRPGEIVKPADFTYTLLPANEGSFSNPFSSAYQTNEFSSAWVQSMIRLWDSKLILTGGVYYTSIDFRRSSDPGNINIPVFDDGMALPQYGVIYRPMPGVGLFALRSESLQPNASSGDKNGEPFPPRTGKGTEFGVKLDLLDSKISGTISYFDIEQTNRVVFDPDEPNPFDPVDGKGANVARGLNRSEGFDVDLVFTPSRSIQILASFSHTDVSSEGNVNPALNGAAEIDSIEDQFGMLGVYRFLDGGMKGLSVGGGANWYNGIVREGVQTAFGGIQRKLKGQWDGDLFAKYEAKLWGRNWVFQFNVSNLFETEWAVGYDPASANAANVAVDAYYYPTKRNFSFSTTLKF